MSSLDISRIVVKCWSCNIDNSANCRLCIGQALWVPTGIYSKAFENKIRKIGEISKSCESCAYSAYRNDGHITACDCCNEDTLIKWRIHPKFVENFVIDSNMEG